MAERSELESTRHEVLAENTAQAVYKHLDKLFQEESRFRSRWIWELLQNARDAAPYGGVRVWLIHEPDRLVFRHNGVHFSHKSITHLIYHGSTKHDMSDPIGQFGTGFLTTHLISKTVMVKGIIDDGKHFDFQLDRRGSNADELKHAMDNSWEDFTSSLNESRATDGVEYTTEYIYPLDQAIQEVIKSGIDDLVQNAAYLLAFNERIQSLHITVPSRTVELKRRGSEPINEKALRVIVEERENDGILLLRYVALITQDGTSAAVELASAANGEWVVVHRPDTPRLFIAFPLTGTKSFCLPIVMNDERFRPREDRDALILTSNRDGKHPNMRLMEQARDLPARLTMLAAAEGWRRAPSLACISELIPWEWLDREWFQPLMGEHFIEPLRRTVILVAMSGNKIPPIKSWIPADDERVVCQEVWDVIAQLRVAQERLPRREEAPMWAKNISGWASFLGKTVEQFEECMTLGKLCRRIEDAGTVAVLQSQLAEGNDVIEWLNQVHELIGKAGRLDFFDHHCLIPDQSGTLRKLTELRRDEDIDEELKNIAEVLEVSVRSKLADRRMRLKALMDLQPKREAEVLREVSQALREKSKAKPLESAFTNINVRFFAWLVYHNHLDELVGFPVITLATADDDPALLTLIRDQKSPDEVPLAPIGCWPEPMRGVAFLFPRRQTFADRYGETINTQSVWEKIAAEGYVRLNPLYMALRRNVPFIPDEPLPVSDKDKKLKHRTKEAVEVSTLAFFDKESAGLDTVRRSKRNAVYLLRFLADYVLDVHSDALDIATAECECGETHRYHRAGWLIPMWENQWVPLGDHKQSAAVAEAVAQLFSGREDQLRQLTTGRGRLLLEALKISLADLSLRAVAKDEDTRVTLINSLADIVHAAANDAGKVRLIAEEIRHSPKILEQIQQHKERREKIERNQLVGTEVERLLKAALKEQGLTVHRQPIGSDYEVEYDNVIGEEEVLFAILDGKRSFLIEVKATVGNIARMTVTQARKAVEEKCRYALCVVPLDTLNVTPNDVQDRCRFIMDISHRMEPVWKEYQRLEHMRAGACTRIGNIELVITGTETRFAVSDDVWRGGLPLERAIECFMNKCGRSNPAGGSMSGVESSSSPSSSV